MDFHWEVNGKTYEFSIPGGGFVSLRQLVEVLGIVNSEKESAAEETMKFVADVENVEFSAPSLVWVGKIAESSTVGELKENYGLECRYSADLTEEQIAEINAQTVNAGDWALISMLPFDTEESLTVTMKNGEVFTVGVTDDRIDNASGIVSGNNYYIYTISANANYALGYDGSAAHITDIINPGLGNDYLWKFTTAGNNYWLVENVGHPGTYLDLRNGNITSTSGSGITVTDRYDGGFDLSNFYNGGWTSLSLDTSVNPRTNFRIVDGTSGARMRMLDEVTSSSEDPNPGMGDHVTVHYVDRNGNVLTNVTKKNTCHSDVVANSDGTFSIPYDISGNVDLRADFDFTDVTNANLEMEHTEYTYANTHLDGKDASGDQLKQDGYLIDSVLIANSGGLRFKSDSGETSYNYTNNPPAGNLQYRALTPEVSLSSSVYRRPADNGSVIPYVQTRNKDIYVVLDPLPHDTSEALNSSDIDAEAPELTKDMEPNNDGTYTLSLTVDAHGRNVSETNKANILFVVDTSSSMRKTTENGSTRIVDTHDAVLDLGERLLDYNTTHPDAVEVAMLTFDGSVDNRCPWTKDKSTFQNAVNTYLRYYYLHTGTDWEDGMKVALNTLLSSSTDDDPTFVIFFTDGEPSQYTNFSGKGENNNTDVIDPITHSFAHESVSGGYPNFYSYFISREGSKDEMRAVVDAGAMLYGIYAYNNTQESYNGYNGPEDGAAMLHNAIKYGYNTSESLVDNLFYEAENTGDLQRAFDKIYNLITEQVGFTNVVVNDGIATGVTSSTVVDGDVSGFTYIIRDDSGALAYKVTVAPNGVPDGVTAADGTPIFTFSEGGTPCIGEKKQVAFARIMKDTDGNPILDADNNIQTEEVTDWVYYYKDDNDKEYIMPIATTGAQVTWDLSPLGLLKDGYSYEVNFVVWPNQESYDLVANLNNGLLPELEASANWSDKPILKDSDGKEYRIGGFENYPYISRYEETHIYSAMSNTGQSVDFYKLDAKSVNGEDVVEITHPDPVTVDPPGSMPLTASMSQIEKQWNVDRNSKVLTELLYGNNDPDTGEWIPFSITFGVFIEDPVEESETDDPADDQTEREPYKSVTLGWQEGWDQETDDYEWVDAPAENNVQYNGVWHKVGTRWAQEFSIATGLMLTTARMEALGLNKSNYDSFEYNNVTYYMLEEGHDYKLEESPKLSYDFDTPETKFHPMLVDGKLQSVTFSRNEAGEITGIAGMTNEENGISSLKVENTLRGYINLDKVVVGKDGSSPRPTDDTKFAYHISMTNESPVFEGDHIPWYGVDGLYYHDDDFNYYQAYLDEDDNLKICTESGTLENPYDAEIGIIDPDTEEFVPSGTFDENNVTGQVIRFNDGSGVRIVTIKGNRTNAAQDKLSTQADLMINQNEHLSIANVPLGTRYTITETQTAGYSLVSVVSNQSSNEKAEIQISGNEIKGNIIQNTDNNVTYTNKVIDGSLQITKNVTVDGNPAVGTDWVDWADGEYFFTITDAEGNPAIGKVGENWIGPDGKVCIVIENGVSETVTVTDLHIGEYTISEDEPDNGTKLVEFKVNGSSKTVENGVVANDDDKKITVTENGTVTTSFTNNINPTEIEVQKVWTDDGQPGVDHSEQVIEYEIYRTPYVTIDGAEQAYSTQVKVDQTLVPTMRGYTGSLQYSNDSSASWKQVVTRLPKTSVVWDEDNEEYIYLTYKYTVKEKTIVEGYKTILNGGEVADAEHPDEYSYVYTITNEPLGPTDQETQIDVKKQWNKADGNPDTDLHTDDTVIFKLSQRKYEALVTYEYEGTTYENIPLYPIMVVLKDEGGVPRSGHVTNEELSTIVYVPAGAEFNITPTEGPGQPTVVRNHYVRGYGFGAANEAINHTSGQIYTIDHVSSAMEITLDLNAGGDTWVSSLGENDNYCQWMITMSSPQGIIWHLDELQERVLENISTAAGADPVPCEGYPIDYSYTMVLTEEENELHTLINTVGNAPGFGGTTDETWEGSVTHLPLYEYEEGSQDAESTSYIYTYEVAEAAINTDEVNTITNKPEGWDGQTTYYLAKWNQDTDETSDEYDLWTLVNQKKPPIDVTLYKVDKNKIPDSSSLLEGAEFKLVKKKMVRTGEEGNEQWTWSKDLDWGTDGESAVVSENSQNPGVFSFENLDAGYYEIVETKHPSGYIQATENPVIQVRYNNDSVEPEIILVYGSGANIGQPIDGNATDMVNIDNKAIVVGNEQGAALPSAGGIGTTVFYILGFIAVALAGMGIVLKRRG